MNKQDTVSLIRRANLDLVNRRMQLIEPWLSAGKFVSELRSSDPNMHVALYSTSTAMLIVAVRLQEHDQYVPSVGEKQNVVIQIPGVPAASEAYLIDSSSLKPVTYQRSGGMRVVIDNQEPVAFVLLTQDPRILRDIRRRISDQRGSIMQLRYELLGHNLGLVQAVQRASSQLQGNPAMSQMVNQAWANWREASRAIEQGNLQQVESLTRSASSLLQKVKRSQWEQVAVQYDSAMTNPLTLSYDLLPLATQLQTKLSTMQVGPNKLPAGNMEDLSYLLTTGWRQIQDLPPGYQGQVELTNTNAQQGSYCLHLHISPTQNNLSQVFDSPPLQVISAPIEVKAGETYLIRGWVRTAGPLSNKSAGLKIYDSLNGESLAIHFHEKKKWHPFSLLRTAAKEEDREMRVHFELSSVGDVYLDDITIEPYVEATGPRFAPSLPASTELDSRFQTVD